MDFKPNKKTSFVAYEFVALSLSILSFTFHPKKHSFPSDILIPKHSQVREREREEGGSNNNNGGNHHHRTTIM
jgi:hypothetical protein